MPFHHHFLREVIKILATRVQILRLKCTKFCFGFGLCPEPIALPLGPPAGFKGSYLYGEGEEAKGKEESGGKGRGGSVELHYLI